MVRAGERQNVLGLFGRREVEPVGASRPLEDPLNSAGRGERLLLRDAAVPDAGDHGNSSIVPLLRRMPEPLENLGALVAQHRSQLGLSLRDAAMDSHVPMATLARIEQGRLPDLVTFRRLVDWVGLPPETFFSSTRRTESTPAAIADHLRSDPSLPAEAADKIASIVRDLYETLAAPQGHLALHLKAAKTFTPAALHVLTEVLDEIQLSLDREDAN